MRYARPALFRTRRGFALLAVLWVIVGLAALGVGDARVARTSLGTARNRTNGIVAAWRAAGCAEAARAATDAALNDSARDPAATWDTLDRVLATSNALRTAGCTVSATAAGDRLDVNNSDPEAIRATLIAAGVDPARTDSLTDAIVDWRDADTMPRPAGAEARWYRAAGRPEPTGVAFGDARELALVRGLELDDSIRALLGTEPGRIVLDRAPLPVIAALPGMSPEAVARIAELRWRREQVRDPVRLGAALSDEARATLVRSYSALAQRLAPEPDAWMVTVTAAAGSPPVAVSQELRLARAGRRAGVVRLRVWP